MGLWAFRAFWAFPQNALPVVSIVVPFLGLPFRILNIELVKPKKGTTMETMGKKSKPVLGSLLLLAVLRGFRK